MKILVTGAVKFFDKLKDNLSDKHELQFVQNETEKLKFDVSDVDYVICNSLFLHNDINDFKSLKYIQVTSAGLDRIPMEDVRKKQIKVYNANNIYSIPIAEWVVCKILDAYKKSYTFYENQKNKLWEKERNIDELNNKIVTIIGYGNIGNEIGKRLKAFNVRLNAIDINRKSNIEVDNWYSLSDINHVVKNSDITIVCLPLTEETEHLIGESVLSAMKSDSILINVSRGKIIDELSLIQEIRKHKFKAVILDVFENEPLDQTSQLWDCENVIITPHNSFVSNNNDERLFELIIKNMEVSND